MKKSLFLTMLAAALLGGQGFAEETIYSTIGGATGILDRDPYGFVGALGQESDATGGNVSISEGGVEDQNGKSVYGGYSVGEFSAHGNKVTMEGGKVGTINGGSAAETGKSYQNTVVVKGGTPQAINGGVAGGDAYDNVVIITGGSTGTVYGGVSYSGASHDNEVHLVGKSAEVTLADALGNEESYSGSEAGISVKNVLFSGPEKRDNSIDIYGYGVQAAYLVYMNTLTFHLTNEQMTTAEACLTLSSTNEKYALDFTQAILQIKDLDVAEWTPGTTVTLVQSKQDIKGLESGKLVDITNAAGVRVAQGKLELSDGAEQTHLLKMTVQGVPEPTTGTLSLLALAGLCARRRKK